MPISDKAELRQLACCKYSGSTLKDAKSVYTVNIWHGFICVQAGWRSVVGYVRQPDRAKMESCRIFTACSNETYALAV